MSLLVLRMLSMTDDSIDLDELRMYMHHYDILLFTMHLLYWPSQSRLSLVKTFTVNKVASYLKQSSLSS